MSSIKKLRGKFPSTFTALLGGFFLRYLNDHGYIPGVIYNEIFLYLKTTVYDKKRKDKAISLAILLSVSSQ